MSNIINSVDISLNSEIKNENKNDKNLIYIDSEIGYYKISSQCFTLYSYNLIFILLDIIIFLITIIYLFTNTETVSKSYECVLYQFGALYSYSIIHDFQIWRIITGMFLHGGYSHIYGNSQSICIVGFFFENWIGHKNFFIAYIIIGIFSEISAFVFEDQISIGASGAIYGIFYLCMEFFILNFKKMELFAKIFLGLFFFSQLYGDVRVWICLLGWDESYKDSISGIAHSAHYGGGFYGILFGLVLLKDYYDYKIIKNEMFQKICKMACILIPILFIIFGYIFRYNDENLMNIYCRLY